MEDGISGSFYVVFFVVEENRGGEERLCGAV